MKEIGAKHKKKPNSSVHFTGSYRDGHDLSFLLDGQRADRRIVSASERHNWYPGVILPIQRIHGGLARVVGTRTPNTTDGSTRTNKYNFTPVGAFAE